MIESVGDIYEIEDGRAGGTRMGWLLYGDVDALDVDLFMGDEDVSDEFPDGTSYGFEAVECYVRKVPLPDGGYRYAYATNPGPGARKCVRIEPAFFWGHWCANHPYEPATTGVPVSQVLNPPMPLVLDGSVYLCRSCSRSFHERLAAARTEALKELGATR